MIQRNRPSALRLFFAWRGSVIPRTSRQKSDLPSMPASPGEPPHTHSRSTCRRSGLPTTALVSTRAHPTSPRAGRLPIQPTSPVTASSATSRTSIAAPALNYAAEFLRGWRSHIELNSAIGQVEAVRTGAGIGVLHDYLARDPCLDGALVRVLPELRAVRSYWLAIHENLRDLARVRVAADFCWRPCAHPKPISSGTRHASWRTGKPEATLAQRIWDFFPEIAWGRWLRADAQARSTNDRSP